jgi:beta-lactamase superfamily II metal-dependent hydrolase
MPATLRTDAMNAEVTMLPVSAGDATLIVWSDGGTRHAVLIDAGFREYDAVSYLQSIGIFHLDLIILSHPDLDHLGGLLAIMQSRAMSVDRIWCFDLAFLREFIRTGKIPRPQPATREVVYAYALRSTLDQFSDILKTANGKGVQVLQVSEGYKLCLGGVLLEVLYPPESLYHALHNTVAIKRMLNRELPDDWDSYQREREHIKARQLSSPDEQERLAEMVDRPEEMPEDGVHLSDFPEDVEDDRSDATQEEDSGREDEPEQLPWRMVGTLYNNLSIVVKATVLGGINSPSILFPGDLSDWTTLVLRQWPNLKPDILKIPHHGSKDVTCDVRALRGALNPRYWPFKKAYSFLFPFYGPVSYTEWRHFYHSVCRGKPLPVIRDIVSPSHILVFPHPQHRLPSMPLARFHSNLIANRTNRDLRALNRSTNMPSAARITVGLERHDVSEI